MTADKTGLVESAPSRRLVFWMSAIMLTQYETGIKLLALQEKRYSLVYHVRLRKGKIMKICAMFMSCLMMATIAGAATPEIEVEVCFIEISQTTIKHE